MTQNRTDLLFFALSDATRRGIIASLSDGKSARVSDLAEEFGASRQAIAKHLDILSAAGVTTTQRQGRERLTALAEDAFDPMTDWLSRYDRFWGGKLEGLKALIEERERS
jgi:DNA-binding transcriptional ArsR family regulator